MFKSAFLLLLCWGLRWECLCAATDTTETSSAVETPKTQLVIIGTIHQKHNKNPKYSPEVLRDIILSLKPDVILNELPLSQVEPNGRPIERLRDRQISPECWAADIAATQLEIKQIPFDRPDREEHYKKTNYFGREKRAYESVRKLGQQIVKNDPNSIDLKILDMGGYASQAQGYFEEPETINFDGFDSAIKMKHFVWYEMIPRVLEKYEGYEIAASDFDFLRDEWKERNGIMVNSIVKAAKEYPGKRLVVITGSEHRYILRDLLKNEKSIEIKEYWEVNNKRGSRN